MAFQNNDGFHKDFINSVITQYNLKPVIDVQFDDGICIRERRNNDESYYFVINETDEVKTVTLDKVYYNILDGGNISGKINIQPCGFYVLKNI